MHYPIYTMVFCQYWQLKAINGVCSAIFDSKDKNVSQLWLVSASILPASNQTQRWNGEVRSHLLQWMHYIYFNELSISQEREKKRYAGCMTCVCASVSYRQWSYELSYLNSNFTNAEIQYPSYFIKYNSQGSIDDKFLCSWMFLRAQRNLILSLCASNVCASMKTVH